MNRKIKLQLISGVIIAVLMCFGCVTTKGAGTKSEAEASQAIPPESPFAKIKTGMGESQVQDILGLYNDFEVKTMAQGYIPFYQALGGDVVQTIYYYKEQGRIYLEGPGYNSKVVKIEYDPTEDGYQ